MTRAERVEGVSRRRVRRIGLAAGPALAALIWALLPDAYPGPAGELVAFTPAGRATAAVAVWMATWWLSEAIPVYATALLPLVLFPLLRAAPMKAAAAPYAHELIFLFMGGFMLALSMQRWGLHRRVALAALLLVGDRPVRIVGGFMAVTAFLSMWVSNTAAAVMLLPVAVSIIERVAREHGVESAEAALDEGGSAVRNFALCLLLGIAYSASIGGMGTPIGTPPNVIMLSYAKDHLGVEIGFARWMALALPLVAVFLPLAWLLLTRVLYPVRLERIQGGRELVRASLRALGPMSVGERIVLCVFVGASALWITRPLLTGLELGGARPLAGLSDAGIAMLAAVVLFVAPVDRSATRFTLDWETAVRLPWGVLLLFGGGLSLAAAIQVNGVGELIAGQVAGFAGVPVLLVVAVVVAAIVFLTELTSNTATAATLIPILAALAPGLGIEPLVLVVPAALSASCAFMLPVATPPNAIVFGSGLVTISEMSRAGFWLNWVGTALITLFGWLVVARVLA
ncbi:MAG: DASS family sodium-coupled anion symporter [Deltaproteobacteria bacterium]|nr:DASS family sodium-coupled anion symporter [Deltaproteobacteria bacterium]